MINKKILNHNNLIQELKPYFNKINNIQLDSRLVKEHDLFLAYKGSNLDGRNYIIDAIENGAKYIVYESFIEDYDIEKSLDINLNKNINLNNIKFFAIDNLNLYISKIAAEFYNINNLNKDKFNIYAITGTNGKTTCSYLLSQLLFYLNNYNIKNNNIGIIGTLGYQVFDKNTDFNNIKFNKLNTTTPDPILVQKIIAEFYNNKAHNIILEASSHALEQYRLAAVNIKTAVFTNLTQDHLDYHKNFDGYFNAKKKLFYFPSVKNIIINIDDPYGIILLQDLINNLPDFASKKILLYSLNSNINISSLDININKYNNISIFNLNNIGIKSNTDLYKLKYNLLGKFNISNLLAVLACLYLNNYDLNQAMKYLDKLKPAPGRMECFNYNKNNKKLLLIVDYAHTPDALKQSLLTLVEHKKIDHNINNIYCIFGCGGDRDKSKRSKMGSIASEYADRLIITDDNPRTEDPNNIINDIMAGVKKNKYTIINSRKDAIRYAIEQADNNDVILIAGKGHEDYQIYGNTKHDYNEREFVQYLTN